MKNKICATVLIVIFASALIFTGCSKENQAKPVSLENTIWKQTKQSWIYPGGDTRVFQSEDDLFTWSFLNDHTIEMINDAYSVKSYGEWGIDYDTLTITVPAAYTDGYFDNKYTILELTSARMKIRHENASGSSGEGGFKIVYELSKQ